MMIRRTFEQGDRRRSKEEFKTRPKQGGGDEIIIKKKKKKKSVKRRTIKIETTKDHEGGKEMLTEGKGERGGEREEGIGRYY